MLYHIVYNSMCIICDITVHHIISYHIILFILYHVRGKAGQQPARPPGLVACPAGRRRARAPRARAAGVHRARRVPYAHINLTMYTYMHVYMCASLSLSLSLPYFPVASIAQLVEPCSWIRKVLSSILASATTEWVTKRYSPKVCGGISKPEIPQVWTSAAPVQE